VSKLTIQTCDQFEQALRAVPFAKARLASVESRFDERDPRFRPSALWGALLDLVHAAISESDWNGLKSLLVLYDVAMKPGERSEMWDASYFAFLEDVRLPTEPARLREVWRHSPRRFIDDIKRDRGWA
jgi:hypothetical protein